MPAKVAAKTMKKLLIFPESKIRSLERRMEMDQRVTFNPL